MISVGKSALLRQRDKGFNRSIYQVKFDLDIFPRPPFFNNLSVLNKQGKEDGKRVTSVATRLCEKFIFSIHIHAKGMWSPKYNKYVGFLIAE